MSLKLEKCVCKSVSRFSEVSRASAKYVRRLNVVDIRSIILASNIV